MGFPKFKKKHRSRETYRIGTGTIRLTDRRHVQLPRLGVVRLGENARRLDRLIGKHMAKIKTATVSAEADGCFVSLQVEVLRPQHRHKPLFPDSKVGVDLGARKFAVIATADGTVLEQVEHPAPLKAALKKLKRLQRAYARSRCANPDGSNRQTVLSQKISRAHAEVKAVRHGFLHKLTTPLTINLSAKTHGTVVVENLHVKGMLTKGNGVGGRRRRRALADAALGEFRRLMVYKCGWYGTNLIFADRWFPSSQICHVCLHRQRIGSAETWTCDGCASIHDRDVNAAINLARYVPDPDRGWVLEGAQQSCGCAEHHTRVCSKRLRDVKTNPRPSLPAGRSDAAHSSAAGGPVDTRRTASAVLIQ